MQLDQTDLGGQTRATYTLHIALMLASFSTIAAE